jgi:altronate dehydratase small subunit
MKEVLKRLPPRRLMIVDPADNVATAVCEAAKGEVLDIPSERGAERLILLDDIPSGHKFALARLLPGDAVVKYGEVIGAARVPIARGEHVHVHNVDGLRGRGDKS